MRIACAKLILHTHSRKARAIYAIYSTCAMCMTLLRAFIRAHALQRFYAQIQAAQQVSAVHGRYVERSERLKSLYVHPVVYVAAPLVHLLQTAHRAPQPREQLIIIYNSQFMNRHAGCHVQPYVGGRRAHARAQRRLKLHVVRR